MKTNRWTRRENGLWLTLTVLLAVVLLGSSINVRPVSAAETAAPYRGKWTAAKKYKPGQIVAYRGWTWIAKQKITRKRCRTVAPHPRKEGLPHCWHRIAKHGKPGRNGAAGRTGANGRDGANGKDGAAGTNGSNGSAGSNGVSGFQRLDDIGTDEAIEDGTLVFVFVECPANKTLLGSGQHHEGLSDVKVRHYPRAISLVGTSGGLVSWNVWVTCAKVSQ